MKCITPSWNKYSSSSSLFVLFGLLWLFFWEFLFTYDNHGGCMVCAISPIYKHRWLSVSNFLNIYSLNFFAFMVFLSFFKFRGFLCIIVNVNGYLDLTYLGDSMTYNANKPKYLFSSSSQHIFFPTNFTTSTTIEHDFSCNIRPWHFGYGHGTCYTLVMLHGILHL